MSIESTAHFVGELHPSEVNYAFAQSKEAFMTAPMNPKASAAKPRKPRRTAANGAPREINVSRVVDASRCLELYRSKAIGLRAPLTVHSVRGDVAHKMAAGMTRVDAMAFLASRLHRQPQEVREYILRQAERMAANVRDDNNPEPGNKEKHFEWLFQGWLIHSQPDDYQKPWEPNPNGHGRRQFLYVFDSKSTRSAKDEHWYGVSLHTLVMVEAINWPGPARSVIQPMQGRRGEKIFRRFTTERKDETKVNLWGILQEIERLWDLEIEHMLEVLRDKQLLTPALEAQAETNPFAVVTHKDFRPVWDAEPVQPDANFRPKAGSHCANCRRLSVCPLGTAWMMENVSLEKWPPKLRASNNLAIKQLVSDLVPSDIIGYQVIDSDGNRVIEPVSDLLPINIVDPASEPVLLLPPLEAEVSVDDADDADDAEDSGFIDETASDELAEIGEQRRAS
jgi:hypothetical protein